MRYASYEIDVEGIGGQELEAFHAISQTARAPVLVLSVQQSGSQRDSRTFEE